MDIRIRRAHLSDLKELQALFVDTINATCTKDYTEDQINAWTASIDYTDRWIRLINNQYSLVAEIDDLIVGMAALMILSTWTSTMQIKIISEWELQTNF